MRGLVVVLAKRGGLCSLSCCEIGCDPPTYCYNPPPVHCFSMFSSGQVANVGWMGSNATFYALGSLSNCLTLRDHSMKASPKAAIKGAVRRNSHLPLHTGQWASLDS